MKSIIDIHTHIFNATDIPIEGYLNSRRSEKLKFLNLEYLLDFFASPILFAYIARRMRERCITRVLKKGRTGKIYSIILKLLGLGIRQQLTEWEDSLSKNAQDNANDLVNIWKEIDLYIPLMIDYEYWFDNTSDNAIKDQIDYIYKEVVIPHKGKIHPFAPYDPAREIAYRKGLNNPDGQLEKYGSLNLVKDAIENKGFIGVKLYNSLGYKPINNSTVTNERKRIAIRNEKMQYLFKGEEYDEVLSELYDYCVKNEVPITTHCGMYGIESYPDASFDFGKAIYWRDVLKQKKYKNLHLNLAHFGWFTAEGYNGKITWVKEICKMLSDYDHLYTDVSHHSVVIKKYLKKFKSDYKKMCKDFPVVKERLLYGTDWHVLRRVKKYKLFKERYIEILKDGTLFSDQELEAFLGGNALDFLGLHIGSKNYKRLEQFYLDNSIEAPEWFTSIC